MKVSEAIKLLESKVVKSEENLKHFPKESQGYAANEARIIAYNIAINKLEQIDEPQVEKVEVSQEFAEWLETALTGNYDKAWCVKEIAGYGWGSYMHDPATGKDLTACEQSWVATVQRNKEKYIKAIYDGYTVKPKQWVVVFESQRERFYFIGWTDSGSFTPVGYKNIAGGNVVKFTDKSKAEAVATLVEGSVEEV